MIVAADHVRNAVEPVFERGSEVVRRSAVRANEHDVFELLVRELDPALDRVVPAGHALVGHPDPDRALVLVGLSLVHEAQRLCCGPLHAIELEGRRSIPVDAEPGKRALDLRDGLSHLAARVRVLDPQQARAGSPACEQPVEEERSHAADVEKPGRARSHANANGGRGHGGYGSRVLYGAHVSSSGGIFTAVDRIEAIGGDAAQIFTQSPRMWRPTNHTQENLARFRERRVEAAGLRYVLCHALYLINLASPDDGSTGSPRPRSRRHSTWPARSTRMSSFTSARTWEPGSRRVSSVRFLHSQRALARTSERTRLLLENSAGAGGTIGRSIEELAEIFARIGDHSNLGLCLDSCHLWASGIDVTDPVTVSVLLDEVDESIGIGRLRALHVNDAATPLGSNRDRHANLLEGLMGPGLGAFLADARVQELPAILETPGPDGHGPDAKQVAALRELNATATKLRSGGIPRQPMTVLL